MPSRYIEDMRLAEFLECKGLLQREFADKIGVGQAAVSRYASGRIPSFEVMTRIKHATNGKVSYDDWTSD
jgi:transcriptional regulator with XRE-family HTH domain